MADEDYIEAMKEAAKVLAELRGIVDKAFDEAEAAIADVESVNAIAAGLAKSQEGQSPEQDRLIEAAAKEIMDSGVSVVTIEKIRQKATGEIGTKQPYSTMDKIVGDAVVESQGVDVEESEEPESTLTLDERLALAKSNVPEIVLRGTITKYKTFYDEERTEPRGWLLKLLDENDRETDDGNEWLCRTFVKWVQELPLMISSRDEHNNRDRSYPTRTKRSIYVNDGEMAFIEELSKEQGILVQEKEFGNQ